MLCLGHIALRSVIVSWLACSVQKHLYSSKQLVVQSMDEITFKIRQGQEDLKKGFEEGMPSFVF